MSTTTSTCRILHQAGGVAQPAARRPNGGSICRRTCATSMAADLRPVFDVPVSVQAVIGRTTIEVSKLLELSPGSVLELDRRVGEAIDIYVNSRLVARGRSRRCRRPSRRDHDRDHQEF